MTDCVVLLGGSFDPVHNGHVALGRLFYALLKADQLRITPAGSPWQKSGLQATAQQRCEMVKLAFAAAHLPITLDCQEIDRNVPTYTIDTLRALRAELGPTASIVLVIGGDQLRALDTWREWQQLFDFAHICIGARPGVELDNARLTPAVAKELARRHASLDTIRSTPNGCTYLAHELAMDISATAIRAAIQRGDSVQTQLAPVVLDYIQQHHLYKN